MTDRLPVPVSEEVWGERMIEHHCPVDDAITEGFCPCGDTLTNECECGHVYWFCCRPGTFCVHAQQLHAAGVPLTLSDDPDRVWS
jgi:hypothetical protein